MECRLKRSREWAIRCVHEASLHEENSFITFTYENDPYTLDYFHFQSFLKRLRAAVHPTKFSFLVAGEYGETNPVTHQKDGGIYRPHWHALLFGYSPPDKKPLSLLSDNRLYSSTRIDNLWRFGKCVIGEVNFETSAYVARYCVKKINGDMADNHYRLVLPDGEVIHRKPEFIVMSKRPAIGKGWIEKYRGITYQTDSVIVRESEMRPPRYYDKQLPDVIRSMLADERSADINRLDHTDRRNNDRDIYVRSGLSQKLRSL
jgi:hypothetical protein